MTALLAARARLKLKCNYMPFLIANRKQAKTQNDLIFLHVENLIMKFTAIDNFLHIFAIFIDDIISLRFTFCANFVVCTLLGANLFWKFLMSRRRRKWT